ncbi:TonB family protein [Paraburkholderia sp. SIMBA_053]|uniref:energy transducer TonB n=1 Tax=Paraburkholderia sp. SIMBA_053 TaxID=3085794 RepID=UPI00397A2EF0
MNAAVNHRYAAARRAVQARTSTHAISTTASETLHVQRAVNPAGASRRARGTFALTAIAVIAVHSAIVWLVHALQTHEAKPPQPLPMTVTLTSAPRALPQAAPAVATPQPQPASEAKPPKLVKPAAARPVDHAPAPQTAAPAPAAQQTTQQSGAQQSTAAPAAPPSSAPAQETHAPQTSAPIGNAAYLHNPAPDYPQVAQDQGWEGHLLLRVHVLADGSPDSVAVQTGSGRRILDDAAREAVQHWRFVPAKRGDEAVDGWVTVPIDFRLSQ